MITCTKCGRAYEPIEIVRCPQCGYKVGIKLRKEVAKEVVAR